ncbi:MAG: calcium-binding protein [Microcoleus vaginatus WJT46-NPBG5]|jgi:Ca2+-binding RTX toxin-like protein|nr:calcium-binding protein [Microcoleus vaginatus WJT46-NPBG5]
MATIVGTSGNDNLSGTIDADSIYGLAGNDHITGLGGNDTIYGNTNSDLYTLPDNDNIDGGSGNDLIYGEVGNDIIDGGTGNDIINGGTGNDIINGAAGIDTMIGADGNDTYYVYNTTDVVTEWAGAGTDTVYAYADYRLSENVENLYLVGSAYAGYGNARNNYIAGNSSSNYLWGGAGIDTIVGGLGNDTYAIDSSSAVVTEEVGAGTDAVYAYASYSLSPNVENLNLQGSAYYGYGNELDNSIVGSSGYNFLWGRAGNDTLRGGAGSDELIGSAGADYFTFNSRSEGVDTIRDFSRIEGDKIGLSASGFGGGLITTTGSRPGSLHPSQFVVGAAAADSSDRIIYNSSTGALFFDSDGTGANLQVQFAYLLEQNRPILISSDFQVIA